VELLRISFGDQAAMLTRSLFLGLSTVC
jgi:hypothetical protein